MAYHHGDLRRVLLDEAADVVAEHGPSALSLRDLARRAGVSHAAPAHHFGDKAGVLTALAAEGHRLLARALEPAEQGLLDAGLAYVDFAVTHPGHFAVMFGRGLVHDVDAELVAAQDRSGAALRRAAPEPVVARAAWSVVHGFAALWLAGAITGEDATTVARPVLARALGGLDPGGPSPGHG
ncbi:TetR/AcrR family transcriptional regulator [Cellulosimicrobium arenosum]|uniref:TetR/AcrR family transcriptional regulator n=1 Tax=Cellulosimicrobium arenosum TaxID=2708133 RepID=A0A927IZ17_9MICO|nr:TetR/AcrR family transcriptional regulator [Cellulosimicrobium arenosum]MBD8077964.1 TetR/AcrR family transcriptional regulator [Cellulosimicrobium arenosum]